MEDGTNLVKANPRKEIHMALPEKELGFKVWNPREMIEIKFCMSEVSKELKGQFTVLDRDLQECKDPPCKTLKGLIAVEAEVNPHKPCDSRISGILNGMIKGELAFAYIEDGTRRGIHAGEFEWHGADAMLKGRMSGVTNAGTHHPPAGTCEPCDRGGHMEGRLDAVVVEGKMLGYRVWAAYAIDFDSGFDVQDTGFQGTIEGVLIAPCRA
jgi:hypothetical protein